MNRIEFMTELAALLQDVPVVERQEAMKYYNDYFDDAGEENEQQVIEELENPSKVAATIKTDLGVQGNESQSGMYSEYRETGYKDTRFEKKDVPVGRDSWRKDRQYEETGSYRYAGDGSQSTQYSQSNSKEEGPKTNPVLKILLILAIVLVGAPVILPLSLALLAVIFAGVLTFFLLFLSIIIASVAVAITGIVLFCAGIVTLVPEIAVGLSLIGTGLILGALGTIGTVAGIKLCMVVLPGIIRGIIWICRRPFHGKAVA